MGPRERERRKGRKRREGGREERDEKRERGSERSIEERREREWGGRHRRQEEGREGKRGKEGAKREGRREGGKADKHLNFLDVASPLSVGPSLPVCTCLLRTQEWNDAEYLNAVQIFHAADVTGHSIFGIKGQSSRS